MKVCKDCRTEKQEHDFSFSGKYLNSYCKVCASVRSKKWHDNLSPDELEKHQESRRRYGKLRYERDKAKLNEKARIKRQTPESKKYFREWIRKRHKEDKSLYLTSILRARINKAIKENRKHARTTVLLGCSIEHFIKHLESLWQPGMNWSNYGAWKRGQPMTWHIDHIKPCISFDLTDPAQQRECFHYSNLQPLWAIDNIKKGGQL